MRSAAWDRQLLDQLDDKKRGDEGMSQVTQGKSETWM